MTNEERKARTIAEVAALRARLRRQVVRLEALEVSSRSTVPDFQLQPRSNAIVEAVQASVE